MKGKYLKYYCSLPLKELRRRQEINRQQTIIAYRAHKTRGLIRLQRIYALLTEAILRKEF